MVFYKICHRNISGPKCYFRTLPPPVKRCSVFPLPLNLAELATAPTNRQWGEWCSVTSEARSAEGRGLCFILSLSPCVFTRNSPMCRGHRQVGLGHWPAPTSRKVSDWSPGWLCSPAQPSCPLTKPQIFWCPVLACTLTEFLTHRICEHTKWVSNAIKFSNLINQWDDLIQILKRNFIQRECQSKTLLTANHHLVHREKLDLMSDKIRSEFWFCGSCSNHFYFWAIVSLPET